ncbi:proline dehydrogenase [Streptomyces sp. NPDC059900]|uniref:proline dehydrogenase n=1 Tax=Streptomyces sp. NPDC059900 TaxID=3155816 RepID=UPI0034347768
MDAGLAAVLGATVGSLATLGAAVVSGRSQARAQYDQWRRQHRRDAYAAYLAALHDRDIAMDAVLDGLRARHPDLPDVDEKVRHFVTLAREVHRAAEVVALEGPDAVTAAADRIARASRDLSHVMRQMVEEARTGDTARRSDRGELAAARERDLYETVKEFRRVAGAVIGSAR